MVRSYWLSFESRESFICYYYCCIWFKLSIVTFLNACYKSIIDLTYITDSMGIFSWIFSLISANTAYVYLTTLWIYYRFCTVFNNNTVIFYLNSLYCFDLRILLAHFYISRISYVMRLSWRFMLKVVSWRWVELFKVLGSIIGWCDIIYCCGCIIYFSIKTYLSI